MGSGEDALSDGDFISLDLETALMLDLSLIACTSHILPKARLVYRVKCYASCAHQKLLRIIAHRQQNGLRLVLDFLYFSMDLESAPAWDIQC